MATPSPVHAEIGRFLVPRGYAVAVASAPGTGDSGGCYDMGGKLERSSLSDVIATLARKGWTTGKVGMYGVGEAGTGAQMALATGQRHLWTVVSIAGSSDLYARHFVNGVGAVLDATSVHADTVTRSGAPVGTEVPVCNAELANQMHGAPQTATGVKDEFWLERDYAEQVSRVIVPWDSSALIVQGLDDEVSPAAQLLPSMAVLRDAHVRTKIILGDWGHEHPFKSSERESWKILLLRWYDHWLKGAHTEVEGLPEATIRSSDGWRTQARWPAPSETRRLFLSAGGRLRGVKGEGSSGFTDNGAFPDPAMPAGPQASFFQTKPLGERLSISGAGSIRLRLSHSSTTGHVAVTLYSIEGGVWTPMTHGLYSYTARERIDRFTAVQPGEIFDLIVPLGPVEVSHWAGTRIGISVGSQPLGMYLNGSPMMAAPSGGMTQIFHGGHSFLELPSIDGIVPESS